MEFREKIAELRMRGATWETIAELLRPVLGCTKDTIRAAMKRPLAARAKRRRSVVRQRSSIMVAGAPLRKRRRWRPRFMRVVAKSVVIPSRMRTSVSSRKASTKR
ncbi:MAG: hypothetical protein WAN59_15520 [Candidatus Baltobacteraceae bacterium]|jgi:hypothetical protein